VVKSDQEGMDEADILGEVEKTGNLAILVKPFEVW
jgi:hypothetical protein